MMALRIHLRALWALLAALGFAVCQCGGAFAAADEDIAIAPGSAHLHHDLLVTGEAESAGYGAYSYILFRAAPYDERAQAIFRAYLSHSAPAMLAPTERARTAPNVTYVPVNARPASPESLDPQWLAAHYDLVRADRILETQNVTSVGPFLLTSRRPLSDAPVPVASAVVDLSRVDQQSIGQWVDQFLTVAERTDTSLDTDLKPFALRVYDTLVVAGAAAFILQDPRVEGGRIIVKGLPSGR